jgi:hypothetical protein
MMSCNQTVGAGSNVASDIRNGNTPGEGEDNGL